MRRLVTFVHGEPFPLRRRAVERVAALVDGHAGTGAKATLGHGMLAVREASAIRFFSEAPATRAGVARVIIPGKTVTPAGVLVASIEPALGFPRFGSPFEAALDAERTGEELTIDSARPGDRLHPLGAPGGKALRRLFCDWKVPASRRPCVPIVRTSAGAIAWVVGFRIADDLRVTPATTRWLRLSYLSDYGVGRFSGNVRSSSRA